MSFETILWLIALAAVAHVMEEYLTGFVEVIRKFIPGITWTQFWFINAAFIVLCIVAAKLNVRMVILGLSVVGLVFINALIHVGATIARRRYMPGTATALLFYIPLCTAAYLTHYRTDFLTPSMLALSLLIGAGWMTIPLVYQAIRLWRKTH